MTACLFCVLNLEDNAKTFNEEGEIPSRDVIELLLSAPSWKCPIGT